MDRRADRGNRCRVLVEAVLARLRFERDPVCPLFLFRRELSEKSAILSANISLWMNQQARGC